MSLSLRKQTIILSTLSSNLCGTANNANYKAHYITYNPAPIERYVVDHADELGYASHDNPRGCDIWKNRSATGDGIFESLFAYDADLKRYNHAIDDFASVNIDVLEEIQRTGNHDVCSRLKLHADGLIGLFESKQLSLSTSGWVEPLLPPMRYHEFCFDKRQLMKLDYLVHDFEAMCNNLKPTSKKVFIDMGASLSFHSGSRSPAIELLELYKKFGINFDHIYGFEVTKSDPNEVFGDLLPKDLLSVYHWINVGVSAEVGGKLNPLHSILEKFSEDDLIVIKLDIDTSSIETPLAKQLLDGGPNGTYHLLVDQFYFEHHVHLGELAGAWGYSMNGTVKESLELFYSLREKGIPAHFWP